MSYKSYQEGVRDRKRYEKMGTFERACAVAYDTRYKTEAEKVAYNEVWKDQAKRPSR